MKVSNVIGQQQDINLAQRVQRFDICNSEKKLEITVDDSSKLKFGPACLVDVDSNRQQLKLENIPKELREVIQKNDPTLLHQFLKSAFIRESSFCSDDNAKIYVSVRALGGMRSINEVLDGYTAEDLMIEFSQYSRTHLQSASANERQALNKVLPDLIKGYRDNPYASARSLWGKIADKLKAAWNWVKRNCSVM